MMKLVEEFFYLVMIFFVLIFKYEGNMDNLYTDQARQSPSRTGSGVLLE